MSRSPEFPQDRYADESISTVHHTLRAGRRRYTISLLTNHATRFYADRSDPASSSFQMEVSQIAREIVALENDLSISQATGEPYHNVYTSLIQTHLPRLDVVAAVSYNPNRKLVSPGPNLLVFAAVAATTEPLAQLLFHNAITNTIAKWD